jgi:hypothetical protein
MNEEQVLFAAFVIPTTRERYVELLATKRGREKVRSALDPFKDLIRVSAEEFLESTPMRLLYFTNFGSSERRTSATSFPSAPIWMGVICRCLMRLRLRLAGGGVRSFQASAEYLDISRVMGRTTGTSAYEIGRRRNGKELFPGLPSPSKLPHVAADNRVGEFAAECCYWLQHRSAFRRPWRGGGHRVALRPPRETPDI